MSIGIIYKEPYVMIKFPNKTTEPQRYMSEKYLNITDLFQETLNLNFNHRINYNETATKNLDENTMNKIS